MRWLVPLAFALSMLAPSAASAAVFSCYAGFCNVDPGGYRPQCTINASPNPVVVGNAATLTWSSNIISSVLSPGGRVAQNSSQILYPSGSSDYALRDDAGQYGWLQVVLYWAYGIPSPATYCAVTLTVVPPDPLPQAQLSLLVTPLHPRKGGIVTVTWSSTYTYSCVVSDSRGNTIGTGTSNPAPPPQEQLQETTNMVLTCLTYGGQTVGKEITVHVGANVQEI